MKQFVFVSMFVLAMITYSCNQSPIKIPGGIPDENERVGTVKEAVKFIEHNEEKEGIAIVNYLIKKNPDSASYYQFLKAMAFYKLEDYKNGMYAINRSIAADSHNFRSYAVKGDIFQKTKQFDSALTFYNYAMSGLPDDKAILNNLATLYISTNKFDKAKKIYHTLDQFEPNEPDYLYNMSFAYYKSNSFDSALIIINRGITVSDKDAGLYNLKGQILGKMRDFAAAEEAFKKSIALKPDGNVATKNLSILKSQ